MWKEETDFRWIGGLREHLIHGAKTNGMYEERCQFAQGHQNKAPCVKARMGNLQAGLVNHALPIKEQIKIDRPWPRTVVIVPAKRAFNFSQHAQKALRRDGCL